MTRSLKLQLGSLRAGGWAPRTKLKLKLQVPTLVEGPGGWVIRVMAPSAVCPLRVLVTPSPDSALKRRAPASLGARNCQRPVAASLRALRLVSGPVDGAAKSQAAPGLGLSLRLRRAADSDSEAGRHCGLGCNHGSFY